MTKLTERRLMRMPSGKFVEASLLDVLLGTAFNCSLVLIPLALLIWAVSAWA